MLNHIFNLLLIFSVLSTTGCVEQIEFDTGSPIETLVVEGKITNTEGPYTLKLSRPEKYGGQQFIPVSGAQVTLFNDQGLSETYTETEAGIYKVAGTIVRPEPSRSYYIEINLQNGKTYRSRPEELPPVVHIDSLVFSVEEQPFINEYGYELIKSFGIVEVATRIPDFEEPVFLRWEVESAYMFIENPPPPPGFPKTCFIYDLPSPQRIEVLDGQRFQANTPLLWEVSRYEIDFSFNWKRSYLVRQYSISRAAHTYWEDLDKVSNVDGTIFDAPPAAVRGNIYNVADEQEQVLGYFEATTVDSAAVFVTLPDVRPYANVPFPCRFPRPEGVPPNACNSCLSIPNSTLERPSYW